MAADGIAVRPAEITDAEELTRIYDYYVKNTAISFEVTSPTAEEFAGRMRDISKRYPYLVILRDGVIEGYAYAHAFITREAYDRCCEMTIFEKVGHELSARVGKSHTLAVAVEYGKSDFLLERLKR